MRPSPVLHLATYGENSASSVPTACGIECSTWDHPLAYVWERGKATCPDCISATAPADPPLKDRP